MEAIKIIFRELAELPDAEQLVTSGMIVITLLISIILISIIGTIKFTVFIYNKLAENKTPTPIIILLTLILPLFLLISFVGFIGFFATPNWCSFNYYSNYICS